MALVSFKVIDANVLTTVTEPIRQEVATQIRNEARRRSRYRTGTMQRNWRSARVSRNRWIVSNLVPWAVYNEYGTSRMSAQPMLGPALAAARARYGFSGSVRVGR